MSGDRQKRIVDGCDKFLMVAAVLDEDCDVTADAILSATVAVLLNVLMDDRGFVAERLRLVADGVESGRYTAPTGGMH